MQILGRLEEFDPTTDTVAAYEERAEIFFLVNGIPEEKKGGCFSERIRQVTVSATQELIYAHSTLEEIVSTLKGHYEPKPPVIAERFNFHCRQQGKDETIAQYVAELRKLTVNCDLGTYLEEALRDRFVCGLRSENVQKKLLTMTTLTFAEATVQ